VPLLDLRDVHPGEPNRSPLPADSETRWELGVADDGSSFDLAILALPARGPLRLLGRGRTLCYRRLLTAHGDNGVAAYDSFAEDARYLPRQPQRASALA
jgi:hypothetical protein